MAAAELDGILRLVFAALIGIAVGFNRELRGKPLGIRTLALVSLGAALTSITAINFAASPNTLTRSAALYRGCCRAC